jgi:DNA-binding MarR family transcriptional regulator
MTSKGQRKANGSFELAESPAHLMRLCQQYYGDLYARETGERDLTKQQFTLLCALEHRDGVSQTTLVETTGIDRSTLAEMVRRMRERGLLSRERTEEDMRANAVAITQGGRKALKSARAAAERAERMFLEALPAPERPRFVKLLATIAAAGDGLAENGAARPRRKPGRRLKN